MTNEREHLDAGDVTDRQVSRSYRELAGERTPERLNQAILKKAAKAALPPYSRSIHWTRPVAWAATIAICLAITLQVTRVPTPDAVPSGLPASTELEEAAIAEDREFSDPTPISRPQSPAEGEPSLARDVAAGAERKESEPRPTPDGPYAAGREAVPERTRAVAQDRADAVGEDADTPDSAAFEMRDVGMLQRAEERVKLQSGSTAEVEGFAQQAATRELSAAAVTADRCDDAVKSDPESWLECIRGLADRGLVEEARRERQELAAAFPDFEIPESVQQLIED